MSSTRGIHWRPPTAAPSWQSPEEQESGSATHNPPIEGVQGRSHGFLEVGGPRTSLYPAALTGPFKYKNPGLPSHF